jgi:hypothetical protein
LEAAGSGCQTVKSDGLHRPGVSYLIGFALYVMIRVGQIIFGVFFESLLGR